MNQEKISKFIKESRLKSNLSQAKFGDKYGVTYQAVSKWENGKNIPDIAILREICSDYKQDINTLLVNNKDTKKKKKIVFSILALVILVILVIIFYLFSSKKTSDEFEFKTLKPTCDNFELYGSIAYDMQKASIYISDVKYCGKENNIIYKKFESSLYALDNKTKMEIEKIDYNKDTTLQSFLKQLKFNVDHYSQSCEMYQKNGLVLEIKATDKNDKVTLYDIPLILEENCK